MKVSVNFPDGSVWITDFPKLPLTSDRIVAGGCVYEVIERGWIVEPDGQPDAFVFMDEVEGVIHAPTGRYDHLHP